jgi:hypothetical protein
MQVAAMGIVIGPQDSTTPIAQASDATDKQAMQMNQLHQEFAWKLV